MVIKDDSGNGNKKVIMIPTSVLQRQQCYVEKARKVSRKDKEDERGYRMNQIKMESRNGINDNAAIPKIQ